LSRTFFTDRDLGNTFPNILITGGLRVERHRDHFAPACPDAEWLEAIGHNGWVAVTHDTRIRYKPNELAMQWRAFGSMLFERNPAFMSLTEA
jgi:hypothetical protein